MKCQRDNNHTGMKMAIQDLPWAMIYFAFRVKNNKFFGFYRRPASEM